MRDIFYTRQQIDDARKRGVPRLREFEAACRSRNPIPDFADLNVIDRRRYEMYVAKMNSFTPYSPWRDSFLGILHSDLVGLSAARDVFEPHLNCLVLMTSAERSEWYTTGDHRVDGWYWYLWWKIHTDVLPRFRDGLARNFPAPRGFDYWIFSHGRGSTSFYELWRNDATEAKLVDGNFAAVCAEHGPIEAWYD